MSVRGFEKLCGRDYCGREPALPAFSTGAHPLKRVGAVSMFIFDFDDFLSGVHKILRVLRTKVNLRRSFMRKAICETCETFTKFPKILKFRQIEVGGSQTTFRNLPIFTIYAGPDPK